MFDIEFAKMIWKQGSIMTVVDADSVFGCTTTRHIKFNGLKYVHIMHNGIILMCEEIE